MDLISAVMWLTLNIYHEARNDDQIGQIAIAHVTLNRVHNRSQSVKEVVLDPYQFSWTNTKENWTPQNLTALTECFESAIIAINGHDFTKGATHYHRDNINPWWAKKMTYIGQFGLHKFYRKRVKIKAKHFKIVHK